MSLVFDDGYHPMVVIDNPQEMLGIRLWCEECEKTINEVYFSYDWMNDVVVFVAKCHGKTAEITMDKEWLRNGKQKSTRKQRSKRKQPEPRPRSK